MLRKKLFAFPPVILGLILTLFLSACQKSPVPDGSGSDPHGEPKIQVQFFIGDQVCSTQSLKPGSKPQAVVPQADGLQFLYWADAQGNQVQPENTAVEADTVYHAVGYPQLTLHEPFLFTDQAGLLNPRDPLTRNHVQMAFNALATPSAANFFPKMPAGDEIYTLAEMKELALKFFPEETVSGAAAGIKDGDLTREDFAVMMCSLLGRGSDETMTPAKGALLPLDLRAKTENLTVLLEACMPHTTSEKGITWADYDMPTDRKPGYFNSDGYLYYVKKDGYLLRDGKVGTLYFGKDGRFTSGDKELDRMVAEILDNLFRKNPGKSRYDVLYAAHVYCRDKFEYLRKPTYKMGATGWEIKDAKEVFTTNLGNCYNYSAAFWALARGLGYEATAISGETHCCNRIQAHAWNFLELNGKTYICDCEWEMTYRVRQGRYDMNMFMVPIERHGYWAYVWKK